MLSNEMRISLTIDSIELSDAYEKNFELFKKGVEILKNHNPQEEFEDEDRELLEEIFTLMEEEQ